MGKPLRVLMVEDSEDDAELILRELMRGGYEPKYLRVQTAEDMNNALNKRKWDIVISDYSMPRFNGLAALEVLNQKGLDLPFIIVSGAIGEDVAVSAMKAGAHDYVMKTNLSRLVPVIQRELREAEERRKRKQAEQALRESERKFRELFHKANDAIFLHELTENGIGGRFLEVNVVACQRLNYSREEFLNMSPKDIIAEEYLADYSKVMSALSKRGHAPYETLLVTKNGTKIPVEISPHVFHMNGKKVVLSIARDITERKQAEEERKRTLEKLKKSMVEIIHAMALIVETRDPYTAGHQRRVAELSCAIAREMGLPQEQIDGINMAGSIHDIGKTYIPAEILSKP
ncbi:PAS domain S-box protein, partial [Candidatus Sumerlaeota bacterium]|nr:PAS domain S-box protein [Candidatus Sumerlaeota bacterium]